MASAKLRQAANEAIGGDPLAALRDEIRAHLENRRDRICRELGEHPRPVPACDVHFNRLLEERAAVYRELGRLDELRGKAGARKDASGLLDAFVLSSRCMEKEAKQKFRSFLEAARAARTDRP